MGEKDYIYVIETARVRNKCFARWALFRPLSNPANAKHARAAAWVVWIYFFISFVHLILLPNLYETEFMQAMKRFWPMLEATHHSILYTGYSLELAHRYVSFYAIQALVTFPLFVFLLISQVSRGYVYTRVKFSILTYAFLFAVIILMIWILLFSGFPIEEESPFGPYRITMILVVIAMSATACAVAITLGFFLAHVLGRNRCISKSEMIRMRVDIKIPETLWNWS